MRLIATIVDILTRNYDKLYNTILWIITPKEKVIVLNAWVCHRGNKVIPYNLGDDINYDLVSFLSHKRVISYKYSFVSLFHPTNYMCIGSVVDYMSNDESIIWGSGTIGLKENITSIPNKVYAVRGPLTKDYLDSQGIECPEVYGDPALLLPLLYNSKKEKKYKVGIIPHIIDNHIGAIKEFQKSMGDDCLIIDFKNYTKWQDVIDQINECEIIASSSLHGLIISDAYNIPNVWIKLSQNILGNDFKYIDYFEGSGRKRQNPLVFINRNISYDEIVQVAEEWRPIRYNYELLLKSCPFYKKD